MKDFLGKELKAGDEVVVRCFDVYILRRGTVLRMTDKTVHIRVYREPEDVSDWFPAEYDNWFHPDKIVKHKWSE